MTAEIAARLVGIWYRHKSVTNLKHHPMNNLIKLNLFLIYINKNDEKSRGPFCLSKI